MEIGTANQEEKEMREIKLTPKQSDILATILTPIYCLVFLAAICVPSILVFLAVGWILNTVFPHITFSQLVVLIILVWLAGEYQRRARQ